MNFLPERDIAADFVKKSMQLLEVECPQAFREMCRILNRRTIMLRISEETIVLYFEDETVSYPSTTEIESEELRLYTNWKTILDLADYHLSLIDAVYEGGIDLYGPLDELANIYDGILTYLRGGIRCPSFPNLLDHFRDIYGYGRRTC